MTEKQFWASMALSMSSSLIVVGAIVLTGAHAPTHADPPPSPGPIPIPTPPQPSPTPDVPIAIAVQRAKLKLSDGRTATFVFSESNNVLTCTAAIGLDEVLGYTLAPVSDPAPPEPGPLPNPAPTPPGPGPVPSPTPTPTPAPPPSPEPAPAASNLRVLFIYDPLKLSALPSGQQAILASPLLRSYLDKHCPLETGCLSGLCPWSGAAAEKTPSYRFLPRDTDISKLAPVWRQTMQSAAGKPDPWMIAVNETGQTVIDQAWPASVDDCLALLRRYGGQ